MRRPVRRYEPETRIDFDNVVSYGDAPTLRLPDPPKSGFRLVVQPNAGAGRRGSRTARAWAYPNIKHKNVYAARLYTSGSLHHSNMYGSALASSGPSPYPACSQEQMDAFNVPNLENIIDVLFANSTQIEGGEQIVFKPGMAFKLTTEGREVTTNIHWLNASSQPARSEIVYDFFTMPDELVEEELAPLMFQNHGFELPARSQVRSSRRARSGAQATSPRSCPILTSARSRSKPSSCARTAAPSNFSTTRASTGRARSKCSTSR